jgi:hypothetical protein
MKGIQGFLTRRILLPVPLALGVGVHGQAEVLVLAAIIGAGRRRGLVVQYCTIACTSYK